MSNTALMDPAGLLPQRHMLLEGDFIKLGTGPPIHRQCWVASMELALEAKAYVQSGQRVYGNSDASPQSRKP